MITIAGLQKTTLLDFPGKVAATIFFGGCNFRCPFCHNASVVYGAADSIPEEEILSFLKKRQGILDGVCVTGGEPLLQKELPAFIEKIKAMGLAVKLDTNGTSPHRLKSLAENGLLDYVAMDIKNSPEKYAVTSGVKLLDVSDIFESADFLMHGTVDFEFRTTVVNELHAESDFESIGRWLAGDEKFFLQGFIDSGDLIADGLSAASTEKMQSYLQILQKNIPHAALRGI